MTCTGSGTCVQAPTDCPGSFVLCDGFEGSSSVNTSTWSLGSGDPNIALSVDTSGQHAHWGTNSLHLHTNALSNVGYVQSFITETKTTGSTRIYVRFWIAISQYPGVDNVGFVTLLSGADGQSASGGFGIDQIGEYIDGVTNTGDASTTWKGNSSSTLPTGSKWTCIEMLVDTTYGAPSPDGVLQAWVAGATSPDPNLSGNDKLAPLDGIQFGLDFTTPSSPSNPVDLYFDDIAIGTSFIDCNQ
jgi:hypothetical protein